MMKKLCTRSLLCFLVIIFAVGCEDKPSSMEGKVLDGRGKNFANIKVVAEMSRPARGYEKFETATGPDGIFRFAKLYPESEYQLSFFSDRWTSEKKTRVESGLAEQTKTLTEPIRIRFLVSKEGVLIDTLNNLEWFEGPDKDTSWDQALSWVAALNINGGNWRIPTRKELSGLLIEGSGRLHIHPFFKFHGKYVFAWSVLKGGPSSAWAFPFTLGAPPEIILDESKSKRAIAVRPHKP